MKRFVATAILGLLVALTTVPRAYGQDEEPTYEGPQTENQKRGQTGFKFLKTSVSARAAGMGDAMTAMQAGAIAMFYNPSGMAHIEDMASATFGQTRLFADINYNAAAVAFAPAGGAYGVFGISFMNVDYGDFEGTIRADNAAGYVDTGTFSPDALMIGVGYAKALTDRFAVGANLKYARQDLTESVMDFAAGGDWEDPTSYAWQGNSENALAVDFGVLYYTGFRSLNFAMSARNFAQEVTYEDENFELPLMLTIGISMDMMDFVNESSDAHSLLLSIDAHRPRDYYENLNIGTEYSFMNTLFLRAGYAFPTDVQGVSLGLGLNARLAGVGLSADYAYTDWGVLGNVNRISLQFAF